MSDERVVYRTTGFGLGTVLFLIFLVLKLTGEIDWSWVWVTAPLWIPTAIVVSFLLAGAALFGVAFLVDAVRNR